MEVEKESDVLGVSSSTLADFNGLIYVVIVRNSRRRCVFQFNIYFF